MVQVEKTSVKRGKHGKGVFASENFKKGQTICRLVGTSYRRNEMPAKDNKVTVRFIQMGKGLYLHVNGNADYLNHSCDPNAGLVIKGKTVSLQAIKNIEHGQEVTYDYSTTMDEDEYELQCKCGSPNCRKVIRDFKNLPNNIKHKYIHMGIVPAYVSISGINQKNLP
jgi:SET domain-containing protein